MTHHMWNETIVIDTLHLEDCTPINPVLTLDQAGFIEGRSTQARNALSFRNYTDTGLAVWANVTRNSTLTALYVEYTIVH